MAKIVFYSDKNAEDVAGIEKTCFSVPWSENSVKSFYSDKKAFALIAEEDTSAAGYIGCRCDFGEGEIENLAVIPGARRHGIGEELLSKAISEFTKRGAKEIFLEVRKSNIPAISLYEKHGFYKFGTRGNYYRSPTEDAILMKLEITVKK